MVGCVLPPNRRSKKRGLRRSNSSNIHAEYPIISLSISKSCRSFCEAFTIKRLISYHIATIYELRLADQNLTKYRMTIR